ncbi:DUF3999 domain-containing protein [Sedimenticola sp.]|uniref:DUF3999 domain-containing protein n=1 Tax=Sedimenticola sp. TaxID=1940285 RepID=UPI003D0E327D
MRLACLLWVLLCGGAVAAEPREALEQGDFAWGIRLEPEVASPIYQLPLPQAVYQGVTRADLGDLQLFNGRGERLPHELQLPAKRLPGQESLQSIVLFPLYGTRAADLQRLSLRIRRESAAGVLTLEQQQMHRTQDDVLRGYLLQLWQGEQRPVIRRLTLHWPEPARGFMQRLKLEQSDDLISWRAVGGDQVIADLAYSGERLVKADIRLNGSLDRFIRLVPDKGEMAVELDAVEAVTVGDSQERPQQETPITTLRRDEQAGVYLFELPGRLPVTRVNLIPAESNTIVRATLYSRATAEAPWIRRSQATLYRILIDGTQLDQTALAVERVNDRFWKLAVDTSGGGLGESLPRVKVSWIPHLLRFSARGEGPFLLAYGSGSAVMDRPGSLLQGFSETQRRQWVSERIRVGQPFELAGTAALTPQRIYDWKQWSLWGVLILATLLLGWMAWMTLRQMQQRD